MSYCGKSLDSFDYAFQALLNASGYPAMFQTSFDCISYRSFAFFVSEKINNCFCPAITWEEYIKNLINYLGIKEQLCVKSIHDFLPKDFPKNTWVLLGELSGLWESESLRYSFYIGCPSYYLCRIRNDKEYLMSSASVVPAQIISKNQLWSMIDSNSGFIAYFIQPPNIAKVDLASVLWNAVDWRNNNPDCCLTNYASFINDFHHYKGKGKYSLQYGIMNYQLQVNKTLDFALQANCMDLDQYRKYLEMLYSISALTETNNYSLIYELDSELWEYFSSQKKNHK